MHKYFIKPTQPNIWVNSSKPCAAICQPVYYCAKLRMLCYVHIMIYVILYALSCVADIV